MKTFHYEALDDNGEVHEGNRIARDRESLENFLDLEGLTLVNLEKRSNYWLHPVNHKERLARFFRNLYLFLQSGMELLTALQLIQNRIDDDQLRACVETIIHDLKQGHSFGDALQSCEPYFPPAAHRICAVAEETSTLTEACDELADYFDSQYEFFNEVYSMLLYPLIILTIGLGITIFLFSFVVPQLRSAVPETQSLPWISEVVFALGSFMNGPGFWVILLSMVLVPVLAYVFYRSQLGQRIRNYFLVRSKLYRRIKAQLFCLSMAMSTRVGLDITRSLELARDVMGNPRLKKRMNAAIEDVRQGRTLTDSLADQGFKEIPLDSLTAGEESGNLSEVFSFQADLLDEEITRSLDRLITVLEPTVILVMAIFVGVIMAAILLPILSMSASF